MKKRIVDPYYPFLNLFHIKLRKKKNLGGGARGVIGNFIYHLLYAVKLLEVSFAIFLFHLQGDQFFMVL